MRTTAQKPALDAAALPLHDLPLVVGGKPFTLLEAIRVVDLTTSVAGPYATMLLSDYGAEVIKIERPLGDESRKWGPPFLDGQSLWFSAINRNKKSVVLDIQQPEGRAHLLALVRSADVVVTSQPPAVQRKLGLDYESLCKHRPDLVFASIIGFGLTGERAEFTCYDLIAEGYSGIMDVTGEADGPPQKVGAPAADMLAGQDAAMAVIAALFDRQRSGRGHLLDISLVESMTRFLTCRISSYLGSGDVPTRSGGRDSVIAIYQAFDTADLPLTLGLGSDDIWQRFWKAVGQSEYATRPEYASNAARRNARGAIVADIASILKTRGRNEWLEILASARVPAGPINRIDELVSDQALQSRSMFFVMEVASGRLVPQIGLGVQVDGLASLPRSAPPKLGQHTEEVLLGLQSLPAG